MQLFKHRNFSLLWLGYFVSLLGDWILDVALPILVYQMTGSGALLGTMIAIEAIPGIVLAPVAGVFVDRLDQRRILIWTNILLGLTVMLLFLVQSPAQLWLIFLVGFLNACLGTLLYPTRMAMVPDLVPQEQLVQANALLTLTMQGSRLFGPALGGAAIALAGPNLAFSLDSATFFFAALCAAGLNIASRTERSSTNPEAPRGARGIYEDILVGFRVIGSTPVLWATLVVWAVLILAGGAVVAVMVIFVREALGGSEASVGYLLSAQGLGMVIGGGAVMALGARVKPVPAIVGGVFLSGVLFLMAANVASVLPAGVALAGVGASIAVSAISIRTIFQTAAPSEFRGRVLASNEAVASFMVFVGAALAGYASDLIGVRAVVNFAGFLVVAAAMLALALLWPSRATTEQALVGGTE